ncbi:plasmid maintenance system killer protein [Pseudomonas sp. JAI111]|nr:plasmid maintenance system killer protein [Pseudomonas sp. JAI111]
MLQFMDRAVLPSDLDLPGWRLHPLKGELADYWSLSVSGNWRVIFRFIGSDIELVDYLDYH